MFFFFGGGKPFKYFLYFIFNLNLIIIIIIFKHSDLFIGSPPSPLLPDAILEVENEELEHRPCR